MILNELQLKFPEIFIGTPLGPVVVGLVFMLGQRWHLGDLQGKVLVINFHDEKCP